MHYICNGECGEIRTEEGVCEEQDCSLYGEELIPCNCKDGTHAPKSGA